MLNLIGSYGRLVQTLAPLKLYSLSKDSLNSAELSAYAAGLDMINARLEAIYRGSFLELSENDALTRKLHLAGIWDCDDCSVGEKRSMLLYGSRCGRNNPTLENFISLLKSRGITAEVSENPAGESLIMKITDALGQFEQKAYISLRMRDILPCHLEVACTVLYCTFDTHDALNRSFDTLEGLNKSFDEYAEEFSEFWDMR